MGVNVKLSEGLLKNHLELLKGLKKPMYVLVLTGVIITLLKKSQLKYIFFVMIYEQHSDICKTIHFCKPTAIF